MTRVMRRRTTISAPNGHEQGECVVRPLIKSVLIFGGMTPGEGPIRQSSQTRRVASQTCRVKVLAKGVAITRWPQCLIDFFARRMSLISSDSTCFNQREDKCYLALIFAHGDTITFSCYCWCRN